MVLLKDKIKVIEQPNLYYNKYKYKAKLEKISGAWSIRNVNTLEAYEEQLCSDWWASILKSDPKIDYTPLRNLILFKENYRHKITMRIEGSSITVFSNELEILKELKNYIFVIKFFEVTCVPEVKFFHKPPKFRYRTYFKISRGVDNTAFFDYLKRQKALGLIEHSRYINQPYNNFYVKPVCFVDYNDKQIITFLSLLHSEKLGKTYKLEWIGDKDKYI